ncbi:hypothetical protein [Streptomyces sp. NPDC006285]|uniref:hypothetical protein n=1 Tax=Streptomyces sp. NPDC006285 TaxID=3364742 RepID=UPI003688EFA2
MVFGNIFDSSKNSAGLFSVTTDRTRPLLNADVDAFEDSKEDTYDDKSANLSTNAIHGASSRAKVVQEQSPEARAVLGFLGSFIQTTQASGDTQAQYAKNPSSVSTAASDGMKKSSETVKKESGLEKSEDLETMPKKDDFAKPPKAPEPKTPETPQAPKATAEKPSKSE